MTTSKHTEVSAGAIENLFKQTYKDPPWPTLQQCYELATFVNIVGNSPEPKAKNDCPMFRESRVAIEKMKGVIKFRRAEIEKWRGIFLTADMVRKLGELDSFERELEKATHILCPDNPIMGERISAAWHKPAREFAQRIEETLRTAGRTDVSYERDARFVQMVKDFLALIGDHRSAGAISEALKSFTK